MPSFRHLRHLIEPPELVEQFVAHPPQGFVATTSAAGTPMFAAPLDLLTTMEDGLKQRISGWPLYRIWGRWLRWRACFAGTTVSEYAPVGASAASSPDAIADDLLRTADTAPLRRHTLLIVKDLPLDSPLLDAPANAQAAALCDALQARGFLLLQGQALAWVPIDFPSIDAYLARLSHSRRANLRRKLRQRGALRIERIGTGDACLADDAFRAELYRLYENVYAQSLTKFDLLGPAFFDAVLQDTTIGGTLFVYRHGGELIGWNLCFVSRGLLIDKYIGLRYPQAREQNLYFVSWIVNLEFALERGLKAYVAGWTDPQVKASLGAKFTFTVHAVRPRPAWMRWALRRLAPLFEGDRAWFEQARGEAR